MFYSGPSSLQKICMPYKLLFLCRIYGVKNKIFNIHVFFWKYVASLALIFLGKQPYSLNNINIFMSCYISPVTCYKIQLYVACFMLHCTYYIIYMLHGIWCMLHDTCYMIHDTCYMVCYACYMVHVTWYMLHGILCMLHATYVCFSFPQRVVGDWYYQDRT